MDALASPIDPMRTRAMRLAIPRHSASQALNRSLKLFEQGERLITHLITTGPKICEAAMTSCNYQQTLSNRGRDPNQWKDAISLLKYKLTPEGCTLGGAPEDLLTVAQFHFEAKRARSILDAALLRTVLELWYSALIRQSEPPSIESLNKDVRTLYAALIDNLISCLGLVASDIEQESREVAPNAFAKVRSLRLSLVQSGLTKYPFEGDTLRSSMFVSDEPALYLRQARRIATAPLGEKLKICAKGAIQVGRHLRAVRLATLKSDGQDKDGLAAYDLTYKGIVDAAINGVDYVLVVQYLVPLLQEFASQRKGNPANMPYDRLIEGLYAGLSADPHILCSVASLCSLKDTILPLAFDSDSRMHVSDMPEGYIKLYASLLAGNAQALVDAIASATVFDPDKVGTGWHIGSEESSTYSISMASLLAYLNSSVIFTCDDYHRIPSNPEEVSLARQGLEAVDACQKQLYLFATEFRVRQGYIERIKPQTTSRSRARIARAETLARLSSLAAKGSLATMVLTPSAFEEVGAPDRSTKAPLKSQFSPEELVYLSSHGYLVPAALGFNVTLDCTQQIATYLIVQVLNNDPSLATYALARRFIDRAKKTNDPNLLNAVVESCLGNDRSIRDKVLRDVSECLRVDSLAAPALELMSTYLCRSSLVDNEAFMSEYVRFLEVQASKVHFGDALPAKRWVSAVVALPDRWLQRSASLVSQCSELCKSIPVQHPSYEEFRSALEIIDM